MDHIWIYAISLNQMQYCNIYPVITSNICQIEQPSQPNQLFPQNTPCSNQINQIEARSNEQRPFGEEVAVSTIEELEKLQKKSSRKYWSAAEDRKLVNTYEQFPKEWQKISQKLQGRNEAMCYSRYRRLTNGKKKYWTEQIDKKIVEKVNQMGFKWKKMSKYIPDRTPKQIRERYLNFLRPNILKIDWTLEQDLKICKLLQIFGHKWKQFEQHLIGRTENQIKGRYYGHLKRIIQKKQSKQNNP